MDVNFTVRYHTNGRRVMHAFALTTRRARQAQLTAVSAVTSSQPRGNSLYDCAEVNLPSSTTSRAPVSAGCNAVSSRSAYTYCTYRCTPCRYVSCRPLALVSLARSVLCSLFTLLCATRVSARQQGSHVQQVVETYAHTHNTHAQFRDARSL